MFSIILVYYQLMAIIAMYLVDNLGASSSSAGLAAGIFMLAALGGCESQIKGHVRGNQSVGNDKETLLSILTQLLPYIGYPRTLNALSCVNEIIPEEN